MGVKTLPRIAERARRRAGCRPTRRPRRCSGARIARQRTVVATLTTLADAMAREGLGAPVITVIGDVVALRDEIAWFERRPLFGKRIVVTRAIGAGGRAARRARRRSAPR